MATVTHYIYSQYDPPQRKEVESEVAEEETQDPWITESSFGVNRRLQNAPHFVPAVVPYDEINSMLGGASSSIPRADEPSSSSHVGSWYRSLPRSSSAPSSRPQASPPNVVSPSLPSPLQPESTTVVSPQPVAAPQRRRNNWFASRVINSEPSSSRTTPVPTLADILSREPPPERQEQPFVPPVFLHIGPSNKGFAMLQQSGWSEGEALGAAAPRRTLTQKAREKKPARTILDDPELSIKIEEREVSLSRDDDVREVRKVEVVDLTLSDSDDDDADMQSSLSADPRSASTAPTHNPTALLTPIATVLKSDRLGIGLKAKTVGPYKESKKRVTHNQAALAAHIRENEEMKMRKALFGRGTRSFARVAKAEAESRKRLLASLNAD